MCAKPRRNLNVERTVELALERIDYFLDGGVVRLPSPVSRHACDRLLKEQSASVITGCLFLTFYRIVDPTFDFTRQPVGSRGKFGDKRLCEELSKRNLTLHKNIVSPFENIGSKGGVETFSFAEDGRYKDYIAVIVRLPPSELEKVADYLADKYAESQQLI
jgi:hypothetical protein